MSRPSHRLGRVAPRSALRLIALAALFALAGDARVGRAQPADAPPADPAAKAYKNPVLIDISGSIDPLFEASLNRRLDQAKAYGAELLVIQIDSPGGYAWTSIELAKKLSEIDWARTVAYVPREALSGAAFIALGCDDIVMHHNARLGDAGPIVMGEDSFFRHAPEKLISDIAVQVRLLAEAKNRPPAVAQAMVDNKLKVYEVKDRNTGEIQFLSIQEIDDQGGDARWEKIKPIFKANENLFLEYTGTQAVEYRLASTTVSDLRQLRDRYGVKEFTWLRESWADTLVYWLNTPLVTILLFVAAVVFLVLEFYTAGVGAFGALSALCFGIFFWSRFLGGTAGWLEVVLFLSGVLLLAFEIFILPGFGVAGISGIVCIVLSLLLASQVHILPQTDYEIESLGTMLGVLVVSGISSMAAAMFIARHFESIPLLGQIILTPPVAGDAGAAPDFTKTMSMSAISTELIGQLGQAVTPLRPAGRIRVGDRHLDVVADGTFIPPGRDVQIVEVSGSRVVVREVE